MPRDKFSGQPSLEPSGLPSEQPHMIYQVDPQANVHVLNQVFSTSLLQSVDLSVDSSIRPHNLPTHM